MKKDFRVVRNFWRNGNLVPAGEILSLTARQAQYIGHVLEAVVPDPDAEPAPAAEVVEAPEPVAVETVTFDLKPARKARKVHGDH